MKQCLKYNSVLLIFFVYLRKECVSCCFQHLFLLLTTARLIKRIVSGWWLLTSLKFISMASITGLSPVWDRIHASLNKLVTAAKQTCSVTQNIKHEGWVTFRIKKKDLYVCIFLKMYQHIWRHVFIINFCFMSVFTCKAAGFSMSSLLNLVCVNGQRRSNIRVWPEQRGQLFYFSQCCTEIIKI